MNLNPGASELVITARLADHYESRGVGGALEAAEHDVRKVKREAPELWRRMLASKMSDRKIGDWLYGFMVRAVSSGMTFRNFAADAVDAETPAGLLGLSEPPKRNPSTGSDGVRRAISIVERVLGELRRTPRKQQNPLKLAKWPEYCSLVAAAYDAAPEYDPKAVGSFTALRAAVNKFFKLIQSKVRVEFVSGDPYASSEQMQREVARTKVFKVMKEHSEHPFFTEEENWKFRAVHDWFSHILAKQPFGQRAEMQAYNTHAKMFPPAALPALFTEIVGQSCYNTTRGGFPVQKVALLPGFDYRNLGVAEGWKIERKRLTR